MHKISNRSYKEAVSIALEHKRAFLFERKENYKPSEKTYESFIIGSLLLNNNVSILLDALKQQSIKGAGLSSLEITIPDNIKSYFNCECTKIKLVSEIFTEVFLEKVEKNDIFYNITKDSDLYKIELTPSEYSSIYFEVARNDNKFTCSLLNSQICISVYSDIKPLTEDVIIGIEKALFKNKEPQLYSTVTLATFYYR